jgi:TatD DNase family protein
VFAQIRIRRGRLSDKERAKMLAVAEAAMQMGFYISFSGIVTFKSAKELQAVALAVPLENMLIETDSPYLAPVPYRGKMNEPVLVKQVAEFLAQLKGIPLEQIAKETTDNFFKLFKIDKTPMKIA